MNAEMQIGEIARKRAKILPDVLIEKGFFSKGGDTFSTSGR